ncbi:hypothetical protein GCM10010353_07490 [Streptomyces chryseus]|uniref:Uncharacterized protein n=1 Tax=Streptomyces chryseus TaxID=68186 RepID=A0ABQ3DCU6_9ACTN|nr:hypothetical protein GCM10010353_07490 [Streptomyces chryseus]GHA82350.1 hypothetical protein GCM10010346_00650 [Streptomyces chryseus]
MPQHTLPSQVNGKLTAFAQRGGLPRAEYGGRRGSPVRNRRGPATVTGEHEVPGSQELSPPVTSNQGADPE